MQDYIKLFWRTFYGLYRKKTEKSFIAIYKIFLVQHLQFLKVICLGFTSQREYRVTETYCYQSLAFSFSLIAINFNYEKPKKKNF